MRKAVVVVLISIIAVACPADTGRILVGQNILVSHESTYPKVELVIAVRRSDS